MDLVDTKDPVEQYEAMTRVARVADESGTYDSIWLYDHFHTVPTPEKETVFECWTSTAGLTRDTKSVKVGQMVTFDGEFYSVDKPINEPKGAGETHPPLWIGGGGEKVTLKLVAKWGDACNVGGDIETLKHKFDVLRGHCEDIGRDYEEITRSTSVNVYLLDEGEDPEKSNRAGPHGLQLRGI